MISNIRFVFVLFLFKSILTNISEKKFLKQMVKINDASNSNLYNRKINKNMITNLTTKIGKLVELNCSSELDVMQKLYRYKNAPDVYNSLSQLQLNPTWLKADAIYDKNGYINAFKTENIISSRKGVLTDQYRQKMKLIAADDYQLKILRISDIGTKDEGKYICREFNSKFYNIFYLNVYCEFLIF